MEILLKKAKDPLEGGFEVWKIDIVKLFWV